MGGWGGLGGVKDTVKMGRRDEGGRGQNGHGIQCLRSETLKGQWHEMDFVTIPSHLNEKLDFEDCFILIGSWMRETGRGVFY